MRIAYVYDAVFPWETGGVQKRVWEVGRRLADAHDVHWYGLRYWDGPAVVEREGVTLHGVAPPTALYAGDRRSIREALTFAARLARPLLSERFDVVDCQEFPYFPVLPSKLQSLLRRSALVLTWHEVWGDYWYEYLGRAGAVGKAVERATATLPDAHVAVSERTRRDLRRLGVTEARVVPNGVSMAEVDAVEPADRRVDVLFVGRLIPEKNAALLVRALAALRTAMPDVRCVVVGDGPERDAVERLTAELDLAANVTVTGELDDYRDVLALMKAASVYALPSRREGFGISGLEALACGTPVVTVAHPQNAAQELVEDGVTGVVCDPDPEAFAAGLREAMRSLSGAACVASARDYEWDRVAELTEETYRAVA
jgi:glycosyltransferase involved in cell wall biosynthesis